ncbi:MAG: O-methyltransferase [Planctomycetota bacterium]
MADEFAIVDEYLASKLAKHDAALDGALVASTEAGLPEIAVSPNQGKLLQVLARSVNARRVLEIGTLGGYSTIWLARALPEDGRVVTLEAKPEHADVARANLTQAGVTDRVDLRVGSALETLPTLEGDESFDFFFIDADKPSIPDYFAWVLKLSRPGSLIMVDNVVRRGKVADAESTDEAVLGCRQLMDLLESEPRVSATVVQTVGSKGHDGFALAIVLD